MIDLTDRNQLIDYLKARGLWLKKTEGQHFLIDASVLDAIVAAAELKPADTVLEVGPGVGTLTFAVAQKNTEGLLLAIERDQRLVDILRMEFKPFKHVKIVHDDALRFALGGIEGTYKVVANLPYQITGALFRRFLDFDQDGHAPAMLVVMIQREVADRLLAPAGSSGRGVLTVTVELFGDVERVTDVPSRSFFPVPEVDSTVVKITRRAVPLDAGRARAALQLVKIGFAAKRRTLANTLAAGLRLTKPEVSDFLLAAGIPDLARAEDLTLDQWLFLADVIASHSKASEAI